MNTLPPERDLSAATRTRQRHELMAIVDHESAAPRRRRRFVPLAAAAAVVLVVGAAIAVPSLRSDKSAGPAGQASRPTPPPMGIRTDFAPVPAAEQADLLRECTNNQTYSPPAKPLDGLRVVQPQANAVATTFARYQALRGWNICGYNAKGKRMTGMRRASGDPMVEPVTMAGAGLGAYVEGIARITITPHGGRAYEAELEHGFFYASVPYVPFAAKRTDNTPQEYVIRAYDASGALIYTGPKTVGERRVRDSRCSVDPTGKYFMGWSGGPNALKDIEHLNLSTEHPAPGMPDPKTCVRATAWNYLP
ncbi:hypothetical protein ACXC9Q_10790 [Kribbella sp. CWNU-51]